MFEPNITYLPLDDRCSEGKFNSSPKVMCHAEKNNYSVKRVPIE